VVEPEGCIDCDRCIRVCPENCIVRDDAYVHDPTALEAAKAKARAWAARQNASRGAVRARAAAAVSALSDPHPAG
jgi:ferredoxin